MQRFFKGDWVVENVIPHYKPLIKPAAKVDRHYFWSNFQIEDREFDKPRNNLKDLTKEALCEYLQVDLDLIQSFKVKAWRNHDPKRQILRNCVLPEAGKYILDSLQKLKRKQLTLLNFGAGR